ncbi:MAG: tetrahydromethanopterin S-methyltransferase subunit H [Chloroflexota bacterium]|nr:tetrahydromethanopterin S-methyltransferase subunit H [Chloroflexota bacterium]
MLNFRAEQQISRISGIEIGGQMGERPPVLIGSIFYSGHKIVKDPMAGIFDNAEAMQLLQVASELSEKYSIPHIIDVIAETEAAMINYVDFVAKHSNEPFLVDATNPKVCLAGMKRAAEQGALERAIYNSIDPHSTEKHMDELAKLGAKHAVLLAFSPTQLFPNDRTSLITSKDGKTGLLDMAKRAGIENVLVDVGVLDLPSTSWTSRAIFAVKDELGLPAGCAPSNALYTWKKNRAIKSPEFESCGAAVFGLPFSQGADFILYGPIRNAPWVFSSTAITAAMIAYGARIDKRRPISKEHPLYKLF